MVADEVLFSIAVEHYLNYHLFPDADYSSVDLLRLDRIFGKPGAHSMLRSVEC